VRRDIWIKVAPVPMLGLSLVIGVPWSTMLQLGAIVIVGWFAVQALKRRRPAPLVYESELAEHLHQVGRECGWDAEIRCHSADAADPRWFGLLRPRRVPVEEEGEADEVLHVGGFILELTGDGHVLEHVLGDEADLATRWAELVNRFGPPSNKAA